MGLSDFSAQYIIRKLEVVTTEEEFKQRVDCITPYSMRHPDVYAAILRKSRELKKQKK